MSTEWMNAVVHSANVRVCFLFLVRVSIVCLLVVSPLAAAQPDICTIQRVGEQVWVALDDLPDYINPAVVYQLFTFLGGYVQPSEASPLYGRRNNKPVVVRFIPEAVAARRFPSGTEGFGGLTDFANWCCFPLRTDSDTRTCFLWCDDEAENRDPSIVLVAVRIQEDPTITLGILTHELSHTLGAVDGVRCPVHEDYNPKMLREPDYQDAYWWYGVTGIFELKPSGVAWDVMHGGCDQNVPPLLCSELEAILSDFVRE